ncbi:carbohydrate-binding domain-containing protein [Salipaludibacillus sp. HK11]|uniref:carbohydrate-binding domain-containing protein n=1 Tax=Salipaludibacillus sp. HK11 TaxID=3394320 RepID=UPI0039FC822B
MRKLLTRLLSTMMIFALIGGSLPKLTDADDSNLLIDTAVKPSVGGPLQLIEYNDQTTLGDQHGNPIQLRGMSTHGLHWFGEIVNDNAFKALANDWDSNMIRLAMYVGEGGYAEDSEVKELVYEGIDLALDNDMYVVVDWHVHAPGDPRADVYEGAYDFFEELADHYKKHPQFGNIIWELANEPSPNNNGGPGITNDDEGWQAVKEYAEPIAAMLNEKGDNIILVGSPNWSQRPDLAADDPLDADNVMYSVHFYTGTHEPADESYPEGTLPEERDNVMSNARYALENGVGLFATEWGTSQANGDGGPYLDEADIWLGFLNENNISWANWSLTNKNETSGSFTPFILNQSDATDLDPGDDQVWEPGELSPSGEYVRSRIKGIEYSPIDRTPREDFNEVIWDFDDGTTQGFGENNDSPVEATLANVSNSLQISGLDASNDVGDEGETYWDNLRLSADDWGNSVNILGAEELTMDVIVDVPTTVSIAAIPQSDTAGWANPANSSVVSADEFEEQEDGTFKALLTITAEDAPNLENIATDAEDNELNNIILFIGTENADVISLDNISVAGNRSYVPDPIEHDPLGEATLPSDFEDATRQGWDWNSESGVQQALTIEEANGSNALSWEFAYPEVKPSDNWASAPRLDFWKDDLVRGDNEFIAFDLYIDPISGRATEGAIDINLVFQAPDLGFWAQSDDTFEIDLQSLDSATMTEDGLFHYEVLIDVSEIENLEDDTLLRNMLLIFADVESDFAGRMFVDNVRFSSESAPPEEDDEQGDSVLQDLEDQLNDLREKIEELENNTDVEDLEKKIEDLEQELAVLEGKFQELESTTSELEELINSLRNDIENLKGFLDDQESDSPSTNDEDTDTSDGGVSENGEDSGDSEKEKSEGTTETKQETKKETKDGQQLPDTATNSFNYMLIGLSLLVIAGVIGSVVFVQKRKKVTE